MKSVIAIVAMIACRAAFAWAHCDIPMLSFSLPRKQETQLMQKMVEQVRDRSDRLSDRFTRMSDNAATRAICDRLGVSNESVLSTKGRWRTRIREKRTIQKMVWMKLA